MGMKPYGSETGRNEINLNGKGIKNMNNNGITQFLMEHAGLCPVSFHMPGHKGAQLYRQYGYEAFLSTIMDCDITEIPGADNLFQAESIIRETAAQYARLYDVRKSYLLINGTSGGILAAVLASVSKGGKLILARNCHKSVFNALALGGIDPVYAYPEMVEEYGISGAVSAEEIESLMEANPDAEAVILPSPNYYGICSDIKAIAEVVHRNGKVLIVDQAHGAHLKFFEKFGEKKSTSGNRKMPHSAEECGADLVINSTHKTLASFTQSAVLNVNSERVDLHVLEDKLQMVESTSPSYILMASLDINAHLLRNHGEELIDRWEENLDRFYREAEQISGLKLMQIPGQMDGTKINLDFSAHGLDGSMLEEELMKRGIFSELTTGNILMCMTGIGNRWEDYERLLGALREIAAKCETEGIDGAAPKQELYGADPSKKEMPHTQGKLLWGKRRPLHPIPEKKELVKLEDAAGRICASSIIPYPPGIPFLCPGEEIGAEEIAYTKALRESGEKVIGVDENGCVFVGR